MVRYSIVSSLLFAAAFFTACSDWTDTESLEIGHPSLDEQNPALWAKYLQNLREYKSGDHKVVYGIFDNSNKTPGSRAYNLTAIPDSVDIVSLMYPDNLVPAEQAEMKKIRDEKGTRVIYTISYPDIETAWGDLPAPGEGETPVEFIPFMESAVDRSIALCDKYGYDGISILYNGKSTLNMTAAQLDEYTARQEAFLKKVTDFLATHSHKLLLFEGHPQYLLDKSMLTHCRYIVLRTQSEVSVGGLNFNLEQASAEGVPTDRFLVTVQPFSTDPADQDTGHFVGGDGQDASAIAEAAYWVVTPDARGYTKAGLAVFNIQNDYFNTNLIYRYTRGAIGVMNPAPNN